MRKFWFAALCALLALCFIPGCGHESEQAMAKADPNVSVAAEPNGGSVVNMELWVMSQCPYGLGAENSVFNLAGALKENLNLEIRFIVDKLDDGGFKSLHGPAEVELNLVQVCAGVQKPDRMLEFIVAHNKKGGDWKPVAEQMGFDVAAIEACTKDGTGAAVLEKDAAEGDKKGATASPAIFINGEEYNGKRGSLDLLGEVCKHFGKEKPAVCSDPPSTLSRTDGGRGAGSCGSEGPEMEIPDELIDKTEFTHTILYDSTAFSSLMDKVVDQTSQFYPNIKIEKVDSNSPQGKKLIKQYGIEWLPAYIFPESISTTKNFAQLGQVMVKTKDGSAFYLNPKQVGANISLLRKRVKGQVKIYYSPFAGKSLTLLLDLFDILEHPDFTGAKDKLDIVLVPRALMDSSGTLTARSGSPEVEAIARHAAILNIAPDKLKAYIKARNKDPLSSYWEDFVKQVGLEPALVKKTAQSDGIKAKMMSDAKEADVVNAGPSFSVLVENRELADIQQKDDFRKLLGQMLK